MTAPVGRWRATYTPGNWVVLSGPTSVVVLEPASKQWASLITTLWDEVVSSASITELAANLAQYRIDTMPSFAAFFWTEAGMRSLVRGAVEVVDPATGVTVASGEGIQTWSEVGLDGVNRVQVELPERGTPVDQSITMELPLVIGAVRASSLMLDGSASAQVVSPQGLSATETEVDDEDEIDASDESDEAAESGEAEELDGVDDAHDVEEVEEDLDGPMTEPMTHPFPELVDIDEPESVGEADFEEEPEPTVPEPMVSEPPTPEPTTPEPTLSDVDPESSYDFDLMENGDTQTMDAALLSSMENGDTQLMAPVLPPQLPGTPGPAGGLPVPGPPPGVPGILAVVCQYGHASPQNAATCRICGSPIAPQGPRMVPRPPLALLRASNGVTETLDRVVMVGRAPAAARSSVEAPALMTVPSPGHDISRTHVEVAPEGWQILVTDLRSTNGTVLIRPGTGERQQLPPGEPVPVPLGCVLELGDGVSVLVDFPQ
ncbi:MAG TPA: FHA domain-containing protein [Propionibacteriaceae bacterium]